MRVMLFPLILLFLTLPATSTQHSALSFGKNPFSYVLLPSFSPAQRASFSVCAWLTRHSNHLDFYQYWISYGVSDSFMEFGISDSGVSYMFGDGMLPKYPWLRVGEHHHVCYTWGEGCAVVYYDGVEIGRDMTEEGRELITPGTLILGQFVSYSGVDNIEKFRYFGGEMTGVNIFSGMLTEGEVGEIYRGGRCFDIISRFGRDNIFVSWQDVLQLERVGSVEEVEVQCPGRARRSRNYGELATFEEF